MANIEGMQIATIALNPKSAVLNLNSVVVILCYVCLHCRASISYISQCAGTGVPPLHHSRIIVLLPFSAYHGGL